LVSQSQITRVATERWTKENFYCPSCGQGLRPFPPGTKVRDFYSPTCTEEFQLKAAQNPFSRTALGANYDATMEALLHDKFPSLIFLHYNRPRWMVEDLFVAHRACITTSCIAPRNPLGPKARRGGWRGYNIRLDMVPQIGRIQVIREGVVREKQEVLTQWKRTESLLEIEPEHRGWTADVLCCVEKLYSTFTLENMYTFEKDLARTHPNNRHIRAKIRQQLQVLRDLGLIEFVSPGTYRYLKSRSK
jgi:type II restriction enzyme